MSILDNIECDGGFSQDYQPPLCERCGRHEAAANDDWCQGCIDTEATALADLLLPDDPLAVTLLDIAQARMLEHFTGRIIEGGGR